MARVQIFAKALMSLSKTCATWGRPQLSCASSANLSS
jgi:hypothetical protein